MSDKGNDTLNRKQAAAYLRSLGYPITHRTLARLAARNAGPPYLKFLGKLVAYERDDLEAWALANSEERGTQPEAAKPTGALTAR